MFFSQDYTHSHEKSFKRKKVTLYIAADRVLGKSQLPLCWRQPEI